MVVLDNNKLVFSFPEIHPNAICEIEFQRTLRIPDDNKSYPLPPGLGRFPLEHVEDYASKLPSKWQKHGGVLLPMYQSEALWINFSSRHIPGNEPYPFAVKIATGKINAVTGESWKNNLTEEPQDYVVIPDQPWLDGYCIQKGLIRQFVAMPQGQGFTAEEQMTGTAEHGGLQIIVYPMKREYYEELENRIHLDVCYCECSYRLTEECIELGLAPGGVMKQEIYEDPHHFDAWDTSVSARCFTHILNSQQWQNVTGKPMPTTPPSANQYTQAGLPWFEYYDDKLNSLNGTSTLASLDSIAAKTIKKGGKPIEDNINVTPAHTQKLSPNDKTVHDGKW